MLNARGRKKKEFKRNADRAWTSGRRRAHLTTKGPKQFRKIVRKRDPREERRYLGLVSEK